MARMKQYRIVEVEKSPYDEPPWNPVPGSPRVVQYHVQSRFLGMWWGTEKVFHRRDLAESYVAVSAPGVVKRVLATYETAADHTWATGK